MRNAASCTTLAGHPAARVALPVAGRPLALWVVADLERLVDRGALLRGEAEPPYWAHLWTGARLLADYAVRRLPAAGARVLEVGCGLGLPGVALARAGAAVTFVDAVAAPLAFVRASLEANGAAGRVRHGDFRALDAAERFDAVLAAEVAYDRAGFDDLARVFARHLAPGGLGLLADGYRTDTRPLYRALVRAGLATAAVDCRVLEEGRPVPIRLVEITRTDS